MGKVTLSILLLPLLLLAETQAPAQGATLRFKSEVQPSKWSRTISGELFFPNGKGPFPAVIFLHPCAGITPAVRLSMNAHAHFLTRNGFAVLVLDSFSARRLGGGNACGGPLVIPAFNLVADDPFNAKAVLARNPKIDGDNIFLAGQSLGANAAMRSATKGYARHAGAFRATAAWYPGCYPVETGAELKSPLLVLGASADDWTPPSNCLRAKRHNRVTGADFEVIIAPGALHGFDQPRNRYRYKGHWLGYDAAATAAGRKAMLAFFKAHLAK